MAVVRIEQRDAFITADGSRIRELAGIPSGNARNQSLAEAAVPPGADTIEHYHRTSEEIYLFTSGAGRMRLGDDEFDVRAGDCVVIAPGVRHKLWAGGDGDLVLWCCCAPAYSHEDTVLLEQRQ
jgi:mannose-6-phosphate isomerase-like protein (cupin superfamily)